MRILLAHNYYQRSGGEDAVFCAESKLLRQYENDVVEYTESNSRITNWGRLSAISNTVWSGSTRRKLGRILHDKRPQIVHFHNTFMRISPSAYSACRQAHVPVVQTLHNYRLLCPAATLFRSGRVCEDCTNTLLSWPGVMRGCWRGSRAATAVVATMLSVHRALGTWQKMVDIYIVLTEFARSKVVEGGLPAEKVVLKPNFVFPDPGIRTDGGDYALFVGRFSPEKGIFTLLRSWKRLDSIPLKLVGEGSLRQEIESIVLGERLESVEILGQRSHDDVLNFMKRSRFLVFPSEWYEALPMVIVEAFACGLPVIASRHGAMGEIIKHGRTGLHFETGNAEDLAANVEWAWSHPKQMAEMGRNARREYEDKYTAEKNYKLLMEIYQLAIERAKQRYGARAGNG